MTIRAAILYALMVAAGLPSAHAGSDNLATEHVSIQGNHAVESLNRLATNIKAVFQKYTVAVDSASEIVSPLVVEGTDTNPEIRVGIRKCVMGICETVDMRANIKLEDVAGDCPRNFLLSADLSQSSSLLSDQYDSLQVDICFQPASDGSGSLELTGHAHRGWRYSTGIVQQ